MFLTSALVVFSDYKHADEFYLRRVIQTDKAELVINIMDTLGRTYRELLTYIQKPREQTSGQSDIKNFKNSDRSSQKQSDSRRKYKQDFGSFVQREI